jgi:peptidylprolyl isomerase
MKKRILLGSAIAALAAGLSACGSSKVQGVEPAPSAGQTQAAVTTTPKPPPALASKPAVSVPKGPPPSRLVIKDLVTGTGQTVQSGQTVTVNYVGLLYKTGTEFDSTWKRSQPLTTALSPGGALPGWVSGLAGMKVGGRRELIVPPSLGYGSRPQAGIPPNSTLVFVVDLLSVS